jgi:hypothetical protein
MGFRIRNISAGSVSIDDLGIELTNPNDEADLRQEAAHNIAISDDLPAAVSASQVAVLDPLDDTTPLTIAEGLVVIENANSPNYRIFGATLNQLDDVDTTGVTEDFVLRYDLGTQTWQAAPVTTIAGGILGLGEWTYDSNTGGSAPDTSEFKFNATPTSATTLRIDYENDQGADLTNILNFFEQGIIYAQEEDDSTRGFTAEITGNTPGANFVTYNITNVALLGGSLSNGDKYTFLISGGQQSSPTDELVKVSNNDTTPGFLSEKLVAGSNITLTELNDGANETLEISATTPPSTFLDLTDTPANYTGAAGQAVAVNGAGNALEFVSFPADSVTSVFGRTGAVVAETGDYDAIQIDYNPATSTLVATNVQAALDEVAGRLDTTEGVANSAVQPGDNVSVLVNDADYTSIGDNVSVFVNDAGYLTSVPVDSVFGRTGAVVAEEGDYDIDQLGDVTITSPVNGEVLSYNGTEWVNENFVAANIPSLQLENPSSVAIPGTFGDISFTNIIVQNEPAILERDSVDTTQINIGETGLYYFIFTAEVTGGDQETRALQNGTTVIPASNRQDMNPMVTPFICDCTAGDTITFQTQITSGSPSYPNGVYLSAWRLQGLKGDKGDTGTIGDLSAVQARRSTVLNGIPLTWTDLNFDTTDFENDSTVIEHLAPGTPDRIEVKEAGTYEIYYFLSADDEVQGRVRINDSVVIPGTTQQSGDPGDSNNVVTPLSVKVYATLAANDFLTVQIQAATTAENLFTDALFLVKKLEGAQGEQGLPGSGTEIIVNDEGALLGTFDTLNFTGTGVTATDAGGGVADITVGQELKQFFLAHNGGTSQTLTTTFVTALFNTNIRNDSIYVYGGGIVIINKTGWFKITSEITGDSTGGRSGTEQRLALNGTAITGTLANGYHRQSSTGLNTHSVTWLVNITSGDNVRVQIREYIGGCTTEPNSCRLLIEEIDGPS